MARRRHRVLKRPPAELPMAAVPRAVGAALPVAALAQAPAVALDRQRETTDASLDAERAVGDKGVVAAEKREETDINLEQERSEADLATVLSQEPFRLLVEQVEDFAIFMLDVDGQVMSWNAGAERLKGYCADEIIGRSFTVFYTLEAIAAGVPQAHLHDVRERGRVESECVRVRRDGSTFMGKVIITAFHDQAGEFSGFIKITRDLSEQLSRAEVELQRTRESLRAANNHLAAVTSLHEEAEASRDVHQRLADWITAALGRPRAMYALFVLISGWIALNFGAVLVGMEPPDAPPFAWLQGFIGIYAAIVTTCVLITTTQQQTHAQRRSWLDLQVNLAAEEKTTKVIELLEELRRDLPTVPSRVDPQAEAMARSIDPLSAMAALEATLRPPKRT